MGDPRRIGKKYNPLNHPWIKSRIEESKILRKEFGFKNQKEILKMESVLKNFTSQAKRLAIATGPQAAREKEQLVHRMQRLGLLEGGATISDVLSVTSRDVLERRLQTLIVKKGLARSVNQARQFIVHRHIYINGKAITAPSYLVQKNEEDALSFNPKSSLSNVEHPERAIPKSVPKEEKKDDKEDAHRKSYHKKEKRSYNKPRGHSTEKSTKKESSVKKEGN